VPCITPRLGLSSGPILGLLMDMAKLGTDRALARPNCEPQQAEVWYGMSGLCQHVCMPICHDDHFISQIRIQHLKHLVLLHFDS